MWALDKKTFSCRKCPLQFPSRSCFQKHLVETHYHHCSKCKKAFASRQQLAQHAAQHNLRFTCPVCGKVKDSLHKFRLHQQTHQPKVQCATCKRFFATKRVLETHQLVHSSSKPYGCRFCPKTFGDPATRRRHENIHKKKRFACTRVGCGRSFSRRATLEQHVRAHDEG